MPSQLDSIVYECPLPDAYTEEEVDEHIMWVKLVLNFSLKKSIEILGDKAEKANIKELQQIHDMGTYKPQDAKKVTKSLSKKHVTPWNLYYSLQKRKVGTSKLENAIWGISNTHSKDMKNLWGFLPQ